MFDVSLKLRVFLLKLNGDVSLQLLIVLAYDFYDKWEFYTGGILCIFRNEIWEMCDLLLDDFYRIKNQINL